MSVALQIHYSTLNNGSRVDGITFNIQTLKKNLDATLALLQERMFNPLFTETAFNRIKKQSLDAFKLAKARPAEVADVVFAKLNYGPNHILGISESGTEETIKNITLQDVQAYYDNNISSQGRSEEHTSE